MHNSGSQFKVEMKLSGLKTITQVQSQKAEGQKKGMSCVAAGEEGRLPVFVSLMT